MKPKIRYYHVPVWMSILIDRLKQEGHIERLKNTRQLPTGLYKFRASYGEETGREALLDVWTKPPHVAKASLDKHLATTECGLMVRMLEEYAYDRAGREETKVHWGIVELLITRAAELHSKAMPGKVLVIYGDFSVVGRLCRDAQVRIEGNVDKVEAPTGSLLQINSPKCPTLGGGVIAKKEDDGAWAFETNHSRVVTFVVPQKYIDNKYPPG